MVSLYNLRDLRIKMKHMHKSVLKFQITVCYKSSPNILLKIGDTAISRLPTHEDFVFSEILCVIMSQLIKKRNVIFCSIDEKMIIAK